MELVRLQIPLAFIRNRAHVTWRSLRFGLKEELLSPDAIPEFALEQIAATDTPSYTLVDIADARHAADVAELLNLLANNEPELSADSLRRRWLYLVLAWLYDNRGTLSAPLQSVEEVYADFGYPQRIASFVRYMPMDEPDLGSREANEARLFSKWRDYLEEEQREFLKDGQNDRSSSLVDQLFTDRVDWIELIKSLRISLNLGVLEAERVALAHPGWRKWCEQHINSDERCRKMARHHIKTNGAHSLLAEDNGRMRVL